MLALQCQLWIFSLMATLQPAYLLTPLLWSDYIKAAVSHSFNDLEKHG
jgi:hypothetical protein